MNYQLHYNKLIEKSKTRILELDTRVEKHHVIPRSMDGDDSPENIAYLTLKEHYVAHHLLWKIHKNQSMAYAFWNMCNTRKDKEKYITSRMYESIRIEVSKNSKKRMSNQSIRDHLRNANMGHPVSDETRSKISMIHKGKKQSEENIEKRRQGMLSSPKNKKGKSLEEIHGKEKAEEIKKSLSEINLGKKQSPETIEKRRKSLIGKIHSEETKEKISEANTGKIRTDEMKENISKGHLGLVQTEESKIKKSQSLLGRPKSEEHKANMRKPKSEEHKRKISETKQRKKLEKLLISEYE